MDSPFLDTQDYYRRIDQIEADVNLVKERLIKIECSIDHIKNSLDNGLKKTLDNVYQQLNVIIPKVDDNSKWVSIFQKAMMTVAVTGVICGIVAITYNFMK